MFYIFWVQDFCSNRQVKSRISDVGTLSREVAERETFNVMEIKSEVYVQSNMYRPNGNGEVRSTGVMRELTGHAKQNVLWWFGHMERMEENQLVKKIMESDVGGLRLQGRP